MYNSNSFIQESIYESQAQNGIKMIPPPVQNTIKQLKKEVTTGAKLSDNNFLKIYEQNMQLKKKQTDMQGEMRQLREKLSKKDQNTRNLLQQELKSLAQDKRSNWDTVKAPLVNKSSSRGFTGNKNISSTKIEHLLEIIDHYKQKLITAQQEITNLKRQKQLLEQDFKLKDRKFESKQEEKTEVNNAQENINLTEKFKRNIRELQLQKERSKYLQLAIKSLEAKLNNQQLKLEQYDSIKSQNKSLEDKIIRLTNLPDFHNVIDKAQEERKAKQLENKFKLLNEKYNSLKDNSIKTEAELRLLQNKLIEVTSDLNSLQKENVTLRQQSVNDPLILKLIKQPQLVQRIFFQIEKDKKTEKKSNNIVFDSKSQIEKLILEKEELAKQVLNYQSKIKLMEQTFKQREKLSKIEQQQAIVAINQPKGAVSSKQGVIYDGEADVFTEQTVNLPVGTNYFDLFLGEVNLLETMAFSITGLTNPTSPLLLATVDFYNHNTEHSKLTQGCRCDLQSQFSFRVNQDDFFLKYLQKGSFQVDIWASEGNKNFHMGKGTIELKHLVVRARSRISSIISTSVPLYLNQKVMGSINIVMRLRLPIFDQLQRLKDNSGQSLEGGSQDSVLRRLVIQIDEGRGFGDKSNTFVYFSFRLEDHYTRTAKGNSPNWNFIKLLQINYDNDFKNYLRKNQIQFTIFDDNILMLDEKNSDIVGNVFISLLPLLEGKQIKQRLEIRKGNQRKGTIDIKIFWHDCEEKDKEKDAQKIEQQRRLSIDGVHQQIHSFMKQHTVDAEKIFRMIDYNKTGNISYDQFQQWIRRVSARKFTKQVLNNYYKGYKQPLNVGNFVVRISKQYAEKKATQPIVAGIGVINQLLKINSIQMKKKTLQGFLVGKNVLEICKQLETDKLGYITRTKLQEYFDKQGIQAQIPNERVKLLDFLKKRQGGLSLTL